MNEEWNNQSVRVIPINGGCSSSMQRYLFLSFSIIVLSSSLWPECSLLVDVMRRQNGIHQSIRQGARGTNEAKELLTRTSTGTVHTGMWELFGGWSHHTRRRNHNS
jgi:hypothetical protein